MTPSLKTTCARPIWIYVKVFMCIQLYNLFTIFNIIHKYMTGDHMLTTVINIFQHLIYSTLVLYIFGLMWRILFLNVIAPHCYVTVPLVQHCFISDVPLYGNSYLKAALLVSMNLSPTFQSWSTILLFFWILSLLICFWFFWGIYTQSTVWFIGRNI